MTRWLIGLAGVALGAFGVFRLLTQIDKHDLVVLALWLGAALLLHDGVLAPVTAALGWATGWLPARLRRYVQGGLVAVALVALVGVALIYREDSKPAQEALLRQDYATNLALLAGLIAGGTAALYLLRVLRDQRTRAAKVRPLEDQTSSQR